MIVLNLNGLQDTRACLLSLRRQTHPAFEIFVVDNGSANGEADVLAAEFGDEVRLIRNADNLGFTGGNAVALHVVLQERRATHVALLNNDATAEPAWIDALSSSAAQHPDCAMFQSHMVFASDPLRTENTGVEITSSGDALPRDRNRARARSGGDAPLLGVCGGAAMFRCDDVREFGFFRDEFFANFEDVDLSLRLCATGRFGRFVPTAVVHHKLNASIRKVRDITFTTRSVRNQTLAYLFNMPATVIALNLPWLILTWITLPWLAVLCGRMRLARALVRGRIAALRRMPEILRERRRLAPLRRGNPLRIWWLQRSVWIAVPVAIARAFAARGRSRPIA